MTAPKIKTIDRGSGWGGRAYVHPTTGQTVPSVTTCLNLLNKEAIPRWAAKLAAEYAVDNFPVLAKLEREEAIKRVKAYPWEKRDAAGDHGTSVHEYAETRLVLGLPARASNRSERHVDEVLDALRPVPIFTEETVWHEGVAYAGTFDGIWKIGRKTVMIDWKSGGAKAYPETALQLTAYSRGEYVIRPDGEQLEVPRIDGAMVIHVPNEGPWAIVPMQVGDREWDAFRALRSLCEWKKDREKVVVGDATKEYQ